MPSRTRNTEFAVVDGWRVAVRKKEFNVGDLVVYCEIDSFLPQANPAFWEYCYSGNLYELDGELGYAVKTKVFDYHISQGLVFPLNTFSVVVNVKQKLEKEYPPTEAVKRLMEVDFAPMLGVRKCEDEFHHPAASYGHSPMFFPQPGCERAQNIVNLFELYGKTEFQITEKIDAVPMTVYYVDEDSEWHAELKRVAGQEHPNRPNFGVCGRTEDYIEDNNSIFWRVAREERIIEKLVRHQRRNVAVQGELCGSSIIRNSMGFDEGTHRFYVFRIFDIGKQKWYPVGQCRNVCIGNGLMHAPILDRLLLEHFARDMEDLIVRAEGRGVNGRRREGIVFTTKDNSFSFKVIANNWLLKWGQEKVYQW
ncbi:RNA ligase, DRB0094 family [Pseudomassariella vexata]|uniref:RNA ligase, DRB0094 family n=1 Tax=Pseudomassariella vexata TaxID=1141098 RepID=A0A1Y2DSP5_9PEZI|nr:RNA ligase, DRB0094 family [Pseudomassariella vexata]ORY61685.1 RNA ligase, DRB0094 family [Pseudomassariella vexata]